MWGKLIGAAAVVIIAALIAWLILRLAKQNERREDKRAGRPVNGDLTAAQELVLTRENDEAAALFRRLLMPPTSVGGDFTLLAVADQDAVLAWLRRHDTRKG